jgi:hypothetical protein
MSSGETSSKCNANVHALPLFDVHSLAMCRQPSFGLSVVLLVQCRRLVGLGHGVSAFGTRQVFLPQDIATSSRRVRTPVLSKIDFK